MFTWSFASFQINIKKVIDFIINKFSKTLSLYLYIHIKSNYKYKYIVYIICKD